MKKMKTKRLLAVLLTLAMVLGMTSMAFAVEGESDNTPPPQPSRDEVVATNVSGTSADKAEIFVGGLTAQDGLNAVAYPIVLAKYGDDGKGLFSGYDVVYKDVDPAIQLATATAGTKSAISITEGMLSAILTHINSVNSVTPGSITGIPMTVNGTAATATVGVGSYLVVITDSTSTVYSPIVASLYYTNENGQNALTGGQILDITREQGWVKSTEPKVDKKIKEGDQRLIGNTVKIGDTVDYEIKAGPIPYYDGKYPVFWLQDNLDLGLDRVTSAGAISVSIVGNATTAALKYGTDYTITPTDSSGNELAGDDEANKGEDSSYSRHFKINFVVNDKYTLNNFANDTTNQIVVSYQAKVNEQAKLNEVPNTNEVVLHYTPDSHTSGGDKPVKDKVYSYTFDIDGGIYGSITHRVINKLGDTVDMVTGSALVSGSGLVASGAGLNGAEFTLYTDPECKTMYTNATFGGIVTTDNGGQLNIKGLDEGTYYLKETKAPGDYSLNETIYRIDIEATYYSKEAGEELEGQLKSWIIEINEGTQRTDSKKVSTFNINQGEIDTGTTIINGTDIMNTKLSNLPSTGGIGTTIFTIAGCLIMILAAALFFASRRKSSKK